MGVSVKTITCHDVMNAGASLQAYALQTYLERLGHEVEIINYKPSKKAKYIGEYSERCGSNPVLRLGYTLTRLHRRIHHNMRLKIYKVFNAKYLKTTHEEYQTNEELKRSIPKADVYLAGSDQIWNVYIRKGIDRAFFLDFAPNESVKASYAASFSLEEIPAEYHDEMKGLLNRLDYISVREKSGLRILSGLGIEQKEHVVDPVFLLDEIFWRDFIKDEPVAEESYILIYDFDNNAKIIKEARKIADERGIKVYSVFKNKYADKYIKDITPVSFVSYIKNADIVISNSFHATVFSIIFEKNFYVFKRKENLNCRMSDLLEMLELSERMGDTVILNLKDIEYKRVKDLLNEEVKKSKAYLTKVMEKGEKHDR